LRTVKNKLSEGEEKKLTADMREIYDRLLPTEEVEEKRKKLVQKLEKIFNDEWPGHDIRVTLFGSSGNLLCSDDSDGMVCGKRLGNDSMSTNIGILCPIL
jgi:DNA polymerase sigma